MRVRHRSFVHFDSPTISQNYQNHISSRPLAKFSVSTIDVKVRLPFHSHHASSCPQCPDDRAKLGKEQEPRPFPLRSRARL